MATFLFDKIIFGPVTSRRLGVSLGINLLPTNSKICTFNCIYCECGWTKDIAPVDKKYPPRQEIKQALDERLRIMYKNNEPIDTITFAGNGEPTLHPDFAGIIDDTIEVRDKSPFQNVGIAVLTNASLLYRTDIFDALNKVEYNILKLDSAFQSTADLLNKPLIDYDVEKTIEWIKKFDGNQIVQTMFVKGTFNGKPFDNTTKKEINAWLEKLKEIEPRQVMIYTIARDTPASTVRKISTKKLYEIAKEVEILGIDTQVSG